MSPVGQRLGFALAATVLASAFAACQGPDQYFRNRGDAGLDLGAGGTFHPYVAGAAGSAGSAGSPGAAGATGTAGSFGVTGAAGAVAAGSAGSSGAAGIVGGAGSSGAAGSVGSAGSAGSLGAAGAAGATAPCTTCMVKVQYTCRGEDMGVPPQSGQASFVLDVTNESSTTFELTSLTLRYWYTIDAGKEQELDCDYATLGCTNLVTSADTNPAPKFVAVMPPKTHATEYVEIAFKAGALALDPFLDTGELQLRLHNKDFAPITQGDDYSYDCSMKGNAEDWTHVTAYLDGILVWGTEPP